MAAAPDLIQGVTWLFTRSIASCLPDGISKKGKSVLERDCLAYVLENHPDSAVRIRLHNDGVKTFVDMIPIPRVWTDGFVPPEWATNLQGRVEEFFKSDEVQRKIRTWQDPTRVVYKQPKSRREQFAGEPPKTKHDLLLHALQEMFGFSVEDVEKLRKTRNVENMGQALNALLLVSDKTLQDAKFMKIFTDLWILDIRMAQDEIEVQELLRQQDELAAKDLELKAKIKEKEAEKKAHMEEVRHKVRYVK